MLKIHQLFFLNILILFSVSLLIASAVSFFTLKSMMIDDGKHQLIQSIKMLEPQLKSTQDYAAFTQFIHTTTPYRVTLIDDMGNVIVETNADKSRMENHLGRLEIMQAMSEPYGTSIRYSQTVKSDFIYVAKQIQTQKRLLYFRLSMSLEGVMERFYHLWLQFFVAFLILITAALIVAYKISQKARYDIGQITYFLNQVSAKNYQAVLKPKYFSEFLQIAILLKNMAKKLRNRDKIKRKYTARLRLINKQQNDILSAISHEFKNPIAAIAGYTETLQDDAHITPAIREKFLAKIHSNALKISHMLDRLALSVKLENNDLSIKSSTFDLDALCREVTTTLQGKYPNRAIVYNGIPIEVHADKTMIDLVITNLIDNAMKYSEDTVTLTLDQESLRVTDLGIGIAENDLENIISKFYRVQKNSWDNSMGLGLAIVSYILKLHNTALTIKSTLGEGSTFGFSIHTMTPPPTAAVLPS